MLDDPPEKRVAEYTKRAEEAERLAVLAKDETVCNSFQMIALGWRHLASQVKRSTKRGV